MKCLLAFSVVALVALAATGPAHAQVCLDAHHPALTDALGLLGRAQPNKGKGIPKKYRPVVKKSLEWIASQQHKDGHWDANGKYPVAMTAMAGMALLMEGSTIRTGRYSKNILAATEWLLSHVQDQDPRNGLIGNPNIQEHSYRYMYGHGFGMLFLASVYGDEADKKRQARIKEVLTRAVAYTAASQSSRGGFYYTSRKEGGDKDEGSVTITQLQALRACKNAGISVPNEVIKKSIEYLHTCTNPNTGAIYYSFTSKQDRTAITAAGVACAFSAGEYNDEHGKKWLRYCKKTIPEVGGNPVGANFGHYEYTHYYFAQCVYILGDDRWGDLFGADAKNEVTWSAYRERLFDDLMNKQNNEGYWTGGGGFSSVGPLYSTVIYATIMQLDNNALPIYQR
jgi:hypothetical protein